MGSSRLTSSWARAGSRVRGVGPTREFVGSGRLAGSQETEGEKQVKKKKNVLQRGESCEAEDKRVALPRLLDAALATLGV